MTSVGIGFGRGRGWAKNTQEAQLRRPGQPPGHKDEIIQLIENLDLNDIQDDNNPLTILLTNQSKTLDKNSEYHELIFQEALNDRDFAIKILTLMKELKFRGLFYKLLGQLQECYEKRDDLLNESTYKFSNFLIMLADFFNKFTIKSAGLKPLMEVLASPLINCLQMVLDSSSEDDIELVTNLTLAVGEKLYPLQPGEMSGLGINARKILILKNLSVKSRGLLSLLIDLDNQKYQPLSVELKKFYVDQLGEDIFETSKKIFSSPPAKTNSPNHQQVHLKHEPAGGNQQFPAVGNNVQVSPQPAKHEKTPPKIPAVNNSGRPRAIRGSGANDYRDKDFRNDKKNAGKKDKNSDAQWSNWNDGKKAWGHDDRFEKDY